MADTQNDGGIVLALFLMVATITFAMYTSISVYVHHRSKETASNESDVQSLVRIFSAWANIGNAIVHVFLILYIVANGDGDGGANASYWEREREIEADGIGGPLGLALFNFAAGMCSIHARAMIFPLVWNSFVGITGTFIPIVWLRFLEEGLGSWPYFVVFVWFAIFAMELTAFCTSWTYHLIRADEVKSSTKED